MRVFFLHSLQTSLELKPYLSLKTFSAENFFSYALTLIKHIFLLFVTVQVEVKIKKLVDVMPWVLSNNRNVVIRLLRRTMADIGQGGYCASPLTT